MISLPRDALIDDRTVVAARESSRHRASPVSRHTEDGVRPRCGGAHTTSKSGACRLARPDVTRRHLSGSKHSARPAWSQEQHKELKR
jgi:hypothetical protein